MATIKKIANLAGVSAATVSYVLNGKDSVSVETRDKVLGVANDLNYLPAKGSGRRRQGAAAGRQLKNVTFVSCLGFSPFGESYFGQLLKGCMDASNESDVAVQIVEVSPDVSSDRELPLSLRQSPAEGLILTGWPEQNVVDCLAKLGRPMVLVDVRDLYDGFSHVRPDNFGGILKVVQYLHELGHRRIGVLAGDLGFACEVERLSAYYMGMMQLNLPFEESWIVKKNCMSELSGYEAMKELISRKQDLTAVMCFGDLFARGAIAAANEAGMSIPEDVSIVGFDNQPWTARSVCPVTTVDTSLLELGKVAFRHLKEVVQNPKMKPQKITVEAELIIRKSTAAING